MNHQPFHQGVADTTQQMAATRLPLYYLEYATRLHRKHHRQVSGQAAIMAMISLMCHRKRLCHMMAWTTKTTTITSLVHTPTSSCTHGYGGSCRRKTRSSSPAAPTVTEHASYRRDEGYGPPGITFSSFDQSTMTITSTLPPSVLLGQTTTTTATSGITTVTLTTTTVTSDLRTPTTVNTCSGSPSASVSFL
jgi:hypothetical protein